MPIRIRRTFDRKSIRRGLTGAALFWQRLEQRWDENPGYVAATTAGTIGILLALSLMISAGIDWFNGPPDEPPAAVAELDPGDELGEPADEVMRGLRQEEPDEEEAPYQFASRRDKFDDTDDPFQKPLKFDRQAPIEVADEPMNEEPEADEPDDFRPPARVAVVETPPKRRIVIEEVDEDEDPPPEPVAPKIDLGMTELGLKELGIEENGFGKDVMAEEDDETADSGLTTSEPAFLKINGELEEDVKQPEASRRIEPDDDLVRREIRPVRQPDPEPKPESKSEPKPEIHRARTEQPAPREHTRWQQPKAKTETPPQEARRSRSTETVVVAPREVPPPRRTVSAPPRREVPAPQKPAAEGPLKLSIAGPATVGLGESCSYVLSLKNTGTTAAKSLVVSIELPAGLVHEVSQSLEQSVASIPPGGTHRSLVRLRAERSGQSVIQADILAGSRVTVQLTARVQVGSTTAARVVMSECCCDDLR